MTAGEQEIFLLRPAVASQLGTIVLGVVLFPLCGLGLIFLFMAWYRIASRQYRLTTERFFCCRGLISRHVDELELYRIKDVKMDQGVFDRMFNTGTVTIYSTDDTTPILHMEGIANPETVKEQIRAIYRSARQQEGAHVTEFIHS